MSAREARKLACWLQMNRRLCLCQLRRKSKLPIEIGEEVLQQATLELLESPPPWVCDSGRPLFLRARGYLRQQGWLYWRSTLAQWKRDWKVGMARISKSVVDPTDRVELEEDLEKLARCKAGLAEKEREAIALRLSGVSNKEIAVLLGISESASSRLYIEGMVKLTKCMHMITTCEVVKNGN